MASPMSDNMEVSWNGGYPKSSKITPYYYLRNPRITIWYESTHSFSYISFWQPTPGQFMRHDCSWGKLMWLRNVEKASGPLFDFQSCSSAGCWLQKLQRSRGMLWCHGISPGSIECNLHFYLRPFITSSTTQDVFPMRMAYSLMFVHCSHCLLPFTLWARFFQDGLTGSAWGDWANYTDSPLRWEEFAKKKLMKMGWATWKWNSFQICTFLYFSYLRTKRIEQVLFLGNGLVVWFSCNVFLLKKTKCCPTDMWRTHEPRQSRRC